MVPPMIEHQVVSCSHREGRPMVPPFWLFPFIAFWLTGAEEKPEPPASGTNLALIVGIVVSLITAGVALYRASAQRGLDKGTRQKIDEEVKRLQTEHDQRRTKRLLRLERFADETVDYQRKQKAYLNALTALLEEAINAGFVPRHKMPKAPEPPPLPPMPDDDEE